MGSMLPCRTSIALLGIADANRNFITVEVGREVSASDMPISNASAISERIKNNHFNWPDAWSLMNDTVPLPYFIFGYAAVTLKTLLQVGPHHSRKGVQRPYLQSPTNDLLDKFSA